MNFKHLYYFWVTAKAGGIMRAGEQLHTTPQTLSGQIKVLEDWLGRKLFRKAGRQLELTEHGRLALGYADQIFSLGQDLETALRQVRGVQPRLDFRVGVADSVSKSVAYRLLEPAFLIDQPIKLLASEGKFEDLLAQLALHRLDLVIADEPMPKRVSVKAFNHALGSSALSCFAAPGLKSRIKGPFPACLDGMPMLVPGATASVRRQLEGWFAKHQIAPVVVGEFDDAALMKAFGREGQGVFLAPSVLEEETCTQFGVSSIGRTSELVEEFYAVSVERRITHPCVLAITDAARGQLFSL
jgi:LysR family transcriptional activator of nhaA